MQFLLTSQIAMSNKRTRSIRQDAFIRNKSANNGKLDCCSIRLLSFHLIQQKLLFVFELLLVF